MRALIPIPVWVLFSGIIVKAVCETPQIANPPPPDAETIPLYGPNGQPRESDIQQGATPDCFLEAPLAAIARLDPQTITSMLDDQGDGTVNATFYRKPGDRVDMTTKKKDFSDRLLSHDSVSCWVAVLQETYQKFLDLQRSDDDVYKNGGWPDDVFEAVYGRSAVVTGCGNISSVGADADSQPMVLFTSNSSGELVPSHVYTVHRANQSHITLRNPWAVVNENGWGVTTNGGKDIHSLGDGVFEVPISSVVPQCYAMVFTELLHAQNSLVRRVNSTAPSRRPNTLIIISMSLGIVAIVGMVSAIAFGLRFGRRRRQTKGQIRKYQCGAPAKPPQSGLATQPTAPAA